MNLNDVVDEPFFNFDLVVQLVGSTSDDFDNVVEVKKTPPHRTQKTLQRQEVFEEQEPDQVADIEPPMKSTPSKRKLFQNRCPKRFPNRFRNLR